MTEPLRVERRVGQRFEVHLPILVKAGDRTISGFTQDVSSRGVFLYTEASLTEGDNVELTFTMPSEITLGESMRVRCQGRVLRSGTPGAGQRNGVAVQLDSYEYLPAIEATAAGLASMSASDPQPERAGVTPR
jgi:PilZ domain-containing protein